MQKLIPFQKGFTIKAVSYWCRIPVLAKTSSTLLAFCEGRVEGLEDNGRVDILLRRSADLGETWDTGQVVVSDGDTCNNPCAIVDQNERIHLLTTWHDRKLTEDSIRKNGYQVKVFYLYSDDNGTTWSEKKEITNQVSREGWTWYATGPGNGIQLCSGRLVVPCNHSLKEEQPFTSDRAHLIYSDDGGNSWEIGVLQSLHTNESAIVELANGCLLHSMRNNTKPLRTLAFSKGCERSYQLKDETQLYSAICQGSIIRLGDRILLSVPKEETRENLVIYQSRDNGETWEKKRSVDRSYAAYSSLVKLTSESFGILYEAEQYNEIRFKSYSIDWLDDEPSPNKWSISNEDTEALLPEEICEYLDHSLLSSTSSLIPKYTVIKGKRYLIKKHLHPLYNRSYKLRRVGMEDGIPITDIFQAETLILNLAMGKKEN